MYLLLGRVRHYCGSYCTASQTGTFQTRRHAAKLEVLVKLLELRLYVVEGYPSENFRNRK